MNNFNNQSANDTNNNNVNITNEETMNYLTTLQSLLTNLTEEKATNERLHAVLDNNKKLEDVVKANDVTIKESIEEFETLLDCYQEENKELQQQYESEGDLSSVVESQEAALAVIADIKKVLVPAEEKEEVVASTVEEEVTPSVVEETTSFWKEKPPARPVITEVAVTNEDFLRLTGAPRPVSREEFVDAVSSDDESKLNKGLVNYTFRLPKEAQYDFWFKNQDIVCAYYWEAFAELEELPKEETDKRIEEEMIKEYEEKGLNWIARNKRVDSLNHLFYNCNSKDSTEE